MKNTAECANTLRLASLFKDHMILQREQTIPIWGWATPGTKITVSLADQNAQATADAAGCWSVQLKPMPTGGPEQLSVIGDDQKVTVQDILFGEVWLASGQSNMQMALNAVRNAEQEIAAADFPKIRIFTCPREVAVTPQTELTGGDWQICTPETAGAFSAVGYFFARKLHQSLDCPVGIIHSSWGGTLAEAWTSLEGLKEFPELTKIIDELQNNREQLEQFLAEKKEKWQADWKQLVELEKDDALAAKMSAPEKDDSNWQEMSVPGDWTRSELPDFHGLVWMRKSIDLPAHWANRELKLNLGPVDSIDVTWFNGQKIGGMGSLEKNEVQFWNVPRTYMIPAAAVKAGRNVITVRIFSTGGAGGLWGQSAYSITLAPVDESDAPLCLDGNWRYQTAGPKLPAQPADSPVHQNLSTALFNAMIAPLIPYALRGAIWYQGESNAARAQQYRRLFPAMIRDWRQRWQQAHFHFYFVQLANMFPPPENPGPSTWAELREAQTMTLAEPETAMAVAIDIGEAADIHPKNKQDVGLRLALPALANIYGQPDICWSGPIYKEMHQEPGKIRVFFSHAEGGLVTRNNEKLKGFSIAGADGAFVWADAQIDGDSVVVSHPDIPLPRKVRYAWADNPEGCNLYNQSGLPASPFRTDPNAKE